MGDMEAVCLSAVVGGGRKIGMCAPHVLLALRCVGWHEGIDEGRKIIGYLRESIYSHLHLLAAVTIQCRRAE